MDLLVAVQHALILKGVSFKGADRIEGRIPTVALERRVVRDEFGVTARSMKG